MEQRNAQTAIYDVPGMINNIDASFAAGKKVQEVIRHTLEDYTEFIGLKHQGDDASMIIIKNDTGR